MSEWRGPAPSATSPELWKPRLLMHVVPFIELADSAGGDVDGALAALGLSRTALRSPSTRLPYYQLHWLTEQLIAQSADPEVGLRAAERAHLARKDVFGNLIRHFVPLSPDLLSVVRLLAHFWTHVCGTARVSLQVDGRLVTLTIRPNVEPPAALTDGVAGACYLLLQTLGGTHVQPTEVRLPRARPERPHRYEQFFGAPVLFEAVELQLIYPSEALRAPVNAEALPEATPLSALMVSSASALVQQIRTHLLALLAEGVPKLPSVARSLGLSARTLRRRLSAARSSYAELVDDVRRERALALARRAELDVGRLAALTGFNDPSAFARAFRRWTGERPREFMRRARGPVRAR
ncbi:MAG TPA: AraC family transcriptional regulator ligand-binding domain-containing protein [Polyangiales bacterium]